MNKEKGIDVCSPSMEGIFEKTIIDSNKPPTQFFLLTEGKPTKLTIRIGGAQIPGKEPPEVSLNLQPCEPCSVLSEYGPFVWLFTNDDLHNADIFARKSVAKSSAPSDTASMSCILECNGDGHEWLFRSKEWDSYNMITFLAKFNLRRK